ncbi:RING zinc finger protein [Toxoplasma gondii TgCatPRC2]|uniref:RING-type E3 ubiquitin transferase n=1 Tax=Toxoplasma gondii TgCatPRC2 TaxID=1130821 RepID=A0A151H6B6_TOXGO|nr:RING zinc finger protein [Toxoplasma gondii TgCatPRC2]
MGGGVSRDRQEPSSRLSYGPQQVVFIPASQNPNVGGRAGTSNVPLQQPTDPRFDPQSEVPVPNPEAVPRLSVQQTCVVKNPVNLHKHSLKCFHDPSYPDRLFVSFLLDSTTEVDISVHYYAQQLTDAATGAPTFVSRLSRQTSESSRRFPAAMNQHFCTTAEEALLLSELHQQQAVLDSEDEDEDGGVYPITVCLRSVPPAQSSGAYQPTMVKNQYTFARILRAPRGGPATGTDPAAADASASSSAGNFGTSSPGQDWRAQIVKQKIQFGTRTFEVQEIFGIERGNSTEMQRLPSGTRGGNVGASSGGDESDSRNSGDCQVDNLAGRECVICLAEERNTAVLPCRHMCLCSGCANIMRMQSNKCPICRQPVTSLLQITMKTNPE